MITTNPLEQTNLHVTDVLPDIVQVFKVLPDHQFELITSNQNSGQANHDVNFPMPENVLRKGQDAIFRENFVKSIITGADVFFTFNYQHETSVTNRMVHVFPVLNNVHTFEYIICISHDIINPESPEKYYNSNQILLNELFEAFPMEILITDNKGFVVHCNVATEKPLGLFKKELPSINLVEANGRTYYTTDDVQLALRDTPMAKAIKQKATIKNEVIGFKEEGCGEMTWLRISAVPIGLPGYGALISAQNITADILLEKQVEAIEKDLQIIMNSSPDMIIFINPDYTVSFVNTIADKELLSAYHQTYQKGIGFIDQQPKEKRHYLHQKIQDARHGEIAFEDEWFYKDGSQKWYLAKYMPVYNEEEIHLGFALVYADVTERKEEELRIQKKNNQLREIAKVQSHELRRPLANIMGLVEILKEQADKEVDITLLNQLELSADNLDTVLRKITSQTTII